MSDFRPSSALTLIFEALGEVSYLLRFYAHADLAQANAYATLKEPWLATDPAELKRCLSLLLETLRKTSLLLQPFIPGSAAMLLDRLGVSPSERELSDTITDQRALGLERFLMAAKENTSKRPVFNALPTPKAKKNPSLPV